MIVDGGVLIDDRVGIQDPDRDRRHCGRHNWLFFFAGLADGSVSAFNIGLWIGFLAAISVVLIAGVLLYRAGRKVPANLVLAILAVPATLFCAFFLLIILTAPSWH